MNVSLGYPLLKHFVKKAIIRLTMRIKKRIQLVAVSAFIIVVSISLSFYQAFHKKGYIYCLC